MRENYKTKIENARIGYQAAITLTAYEVESYWTRYYAMLVANSIIIAIVTSLIKETSLFLRIFSSLLVVMGMLLCLFWRCVIARSTAYHNYWLASARELENKYLNPVQTITRGRILAEKKKVTIKDGREKETIKMNWWGKHKIRKVADSVVWGFVVLYAILLLLFIFSLFNASLLN